MYIEVHTKAWASTQYNAIQSKLCSKNNLFCGVHNVPFLIRHICFLLCTHLQKRMHTLQMHLCQPVAAVYQCSEDFLFLTRTAQSRHAKKFAVPCPFMHLCKHSESGPVAPLLRCFSTLPLTDPFFACNTLSFFFPAIMWEFCLKFALLIVYVTEVIKKWLLPRLWLTYHVTYFKRSLGN